MILIVRDHYKRKNSLPFRGGQGRKQEGTSYLQPLEKCRHLLAHQAGIADGSGVVGVSQGDPVGQPHVHWLGQLRFQRCCQLPDPAFQLAIDLRVSHRWSVPPKGRAVLVSLYSLTPTHQFLDDVDSSQKERSSSPRHYWHWGGRTLWQ